MSRNSNSTLEEQVFELFWSHDSLSRADIIEALSMDVSDASVKRVLQKLNKDGKLLITGAGRATRYQLSPNGRLMSTINLDTYYSRDIDERHIITGFNFELMSTLLPGANLFTPDELAHLNALQAEFHANISQLSDAAKHKEMTRLGVDLSWKSSQIEGNTYTLLETERLLLEQRTADGKTRDEATMLLNHKAALDFIVAEPDYLQNLSVAHIEDIHSILVRDLQVDRNIRHRRVGITGTNYRPLDNEYQIREALDSMCRLVNETACVFSKSLLVLVLLSYIQAFMDGNKRVARLAANAVLIAHGYCPISFRSVESLDYKKAMLIFYEQNNITAFKKIFMEQFEFAVKSYF